jgi:hypothetical protein
MGKGGGEPDSLRGQLVQVGGETVRITVDTKDIRPQCVDGDEEQVVTVKKTRGDVLGGSRRRMGAP